MPKDKSNKTPKGRYNLRSKKNGKDKESYKKTQSSDSSSSESEYESDDLPIMDKSEYTKMLSKIFPSTHMMQKVKNMEEADKKAEKGRSKKSSTKKESEWQSLALLLAGKNVPIRLITG